MDPKIADLLQPGPFREFLASKPAEERYDFGSPTQCPLAQYLAANLGRSGWVGTTTIFSAPSDHGELESPIPEGWTKALAGCDLFDSTAHWDTTKWTWGQALTRFDALPAAA